MPTTINLILAPFIFVPTFTYTLAKQGKRLSSSGVASVLVRVEAESDSLNEVSDCEVGVFEHGWNSINEVGKRFDS